MDIKTKYNIGDVVLCIENIGTENSFSIRGLLSIARINVEVIGFKSKSTNGTNSPGIKIQYGFRTKSSHHGDYYWVDEQCVFSSLEDVSVGLNDLGYSLNCKKEKKRIKDGGEFPFLAIKEDNFADTLPDSNQLSDKELPF